MVSTWMLKPFKDWLSISSAFTFVLTVASSTYSPAVSRPSIGAHDDSRRMLATIDSATLCRLLPTMIASCQNARLRIRQLALRILRNPRRARLVPILFGESSHRRAAASSDPNVWTLFDGFQL